MTRNRKFRCENDHEFESLAPASCPICGLEFITDEESAECAWCGAGDLIDATDIDIDRVTTAEPYIEEFLGGRAPLTIPAIPLHDNCRDDIHDSPDCADDRIAEYLTNRRGS
jgi:hypothetical protein